jgi:hypothetical protein
VLEAVQKRFDGDSNAMRQWRDGRAPVRHIKMRMGAAHLQNESLANVATEMGLRVLAYQFTRELNIFSIKPMMVAVRA